jgi:hypothetical protein
MKTLVTIFAHRGAEEVCRRHFTQWAKHQSDILILSPTDLPIRRDLKHPNLFYANSGQSQYSGPRAICRFKTAFNWLALLPYDRHLIFEYDAFCLTKQIPIPADQFFGNRKATNNYPWSLAFKTPHLFYAPWLLSSVTLKRLCAAFQSIPDNQEGGCFDRYLDLAMTRAAIQSADWADLGFAMETITYPLGVDHMREAIKYGATMLHGIKTVQVFSAALEAFDDRAKILTLAEPPHEFAT